MPVTTKETAQFVVADALLGTPEDELLTMQEDLKRAMKKAVKDRRWVMALDLRKCVGCSACTIACIVENKLPPGVVYRPVLDEEFGMYPNVSRRFLPRPCMQCDNPPCVPVCPVDATYKRADGVVEINYDQCIGCRYCVTACPYGARTFDFGETFTSRAPTQAGVIVGRARVEPYENAPSYEYGVTWERQAQNSPIGNVRKCHFCLHRLNAGMLPACVTTCIGRATYFGDANDSNALVTGKMGSPNVIRLKEELGTQPKVFYLL